MQRHPAHQSRNQKPANTNLICATKAAQRKKVPKHHIFISSYISEICVNCANIQRLGVPDKLRQSVRKFCEKLLPEKNLCFPQKYGFENARKNLRPFSQIFGPGPLAGSLSQNLTPGGSIPVSVDLAMLPAGDPSLSTKCALSKSSKTLQRVLVVLTWQGTP